MRDRLIELLTDNLPRCGNLPHWDNPLQLSCDEQVERIADHLLESGVIVPPMRLGQVCFKTYSWKNEADECRVSSITQKADGTFKTRLTILRDKSVFEITEDEIGKTVFLTKEEAERALKEREKV